MVRFCSRGLAVVVTLVTAFAALTPVAQAQGIEFYLDDGRGPPPPRYYDGRYERRSDRDRDWDRDRRRGCSPRRAMEVADYFGLRRARIVDVTPRRVVIAGIGRRGERTQLVLANNRSCDRLN